MPPKSDHQTRLKATGISCKNRNNLYQPDPVMNHQIPIHQVVCIDSIGGIGKNGDLPWKINSDWEHFLSLSTEITVTNCVHHYRRHLQLILFAGHFKTLCGMDNGKSLLRAAFQAKWSVSTIVRTGA